MPESTRPRLAAALSLALAAVPALATVSEPPDPLRPGLSPAQRLTALIDRVRAAHSGLRTLEAEFTQFRESAMLVEPTRASGVFSYAAPDRIRWEFRSPDPISLVIRDDEMTTWYRDLGQAQRVKVGRHSQRVLKYLGAGSSVEELLRYFTVRLRLPGDGTEPYRLHLDPRYARVAKRLEGMVLWIDPQLFLPSRLRYVEADGDVTEYHFEKLRPNADLPADRFELDLPESVEVRVIDLQRQAGAP